MSYAIDSFEGKPAGAFTPLRKVASKWGPEPFRCASSRDGELLFVPEAIYQIMNLNLNSIRGSMLSDNSPLGVLARANNLSLCLASHMV